MSHDPMTDLRAADVVRAVNRRRFLTSFVVGAGLAPLATLSRGARASVAPDQQASLCFGTKPVIQPSDIQYLGCMRMPNGTDTTFAYGNIAGRKVNGETRLFVFGNSPTLGDPVYELVDTGSYHTDYRQAPRAGLVRNWGNVYGNRRVSYDNNNGQQFNLQYQVPGGLYFNENTQLLYWTYYDAYNNTVRPDWNLGATRLETGGPVAFGPWRSRTVDGDNRTWYGASRLAYLTELPDGSMGGAGIYFVTTAAPWGPQLFGGGTWPTTSTPAGFGAGDLVLPNRYLTYYSMIGQINASTGQYTGQLRSFRRQAPYNYVWHPSGSGIATEIDPLRYNGIGSWTQLDGLHGAVWIDLPDKHGALFPVSFAGSPTANPGACGTGHIWYRNVGQGSDRCSHGCAAEIDIAGPVTDAAMTAMVIYDPDQLRDVQAGRLTDYSVEPRSVLNVDQLGVQTAPHAVLGHGKALRGFYFDRTARKLYLRANSADDSTPGIRTDLIHVFRIA
jgi:hypothetical protein